MCLFWKNWDLLWALVPLIDCHSSQKSHGRKRYCCIWKPGLDEWPWRSCTGILEAQHRWKLEWVKPLMVWQNTAYLNKPLASAFRQLDRVLHFCCLSASFLCYSPESLRWCAAVAYLPWTGCWVGIQIHCWFSMCIIPSYEFNIPLPV